MTEGIPITDEFINWVIDEAIKAGAVPAAYGEQLRQLIGQETLDISVDQMIYEEVKQHFIDITDEVKMALMEAGQPGIAHGLNQVCVNPSKFDDRGLAMAVAAKPWFNAEKLNEEEDRALRRAIVLAARQHGIDIP